MAEISEGFTNKAYINDWDLKMPQVFVKAEKSEKVENKITHKYWNQVIIFAFFMFAK